MLGLGHRAGVRDDILIHASRFETGEIFVQLRQPDIAVAIDHINAPVVIKTTAEWTCKEGQNDVSVQGPFSTSFVRKMYVLRVVVENVDA